MKIQLQISYQEIISLENLFAAWQEFLAGKRKKKDVQEFGLRLADNILQLHEELANFTYAHGGYEAFSISDPKPRNIHKANVRDRVLHHAIYRKLYPFFDKVFIADSYSCRIAKGTHKAISRFSDFCHQVGKNNTRTVWVLKCDIKKFFASIGHKILLEILEGYIPDKNIIWLLERVIGSFKIRPHLSLGHLTGLRPTLSGIEQVGCTCDILSLSFDHELKAEWPGEEENRGLPLGNLTSQLFCNVYMNEFDQFVKHRLRTRYYVRYADDFVFLSDNKDRLLSLIQQVGEFLDERLKLSLHPDKVFIETLASGVDFLGWVNFPYHRVLRSVAKRRMFKGVRERPKNEILQSYFGLISHGNAYKLKREILNWYGLLADKSGNGLEL